MRGISEKRLIEEIELYDIDVHARDILNSLIDECQELNPWQPIDENTPKDRPILFYYPPRYQRNEDTLISSEPSNTRAVEFRFATHWMELPEPPK